MYHDYFGLEEAPFSITPDPSFIYLSVRHRDALAHLLYGVGQGGSGGFVQLTGEVGTGKTTLCRALLEQVPEGTRIALVLNPLMNPIEMLAAISEELGIDTEGKEDSAKALVDNLTAYLLEVHELGGRAVVVIDEAQNLSPDSLEQIRLLTNLETSKQKLLQIILLGQPELRALLRRQSLRQLAQRITARYHLTPLGEKDTAQYVAHRLAVAGAQENPFTRSGLKALFQRSQGVPRLINIIADRAMVAAYATEKRDINRRMVNAAADEIQLGERAVRRRPWLAYGAAFAVLAIVASVAVWLGYGAGPGLEKVASSPVEPPLTAPRDNRETASQVAVTADERAIASSGNLPLSRVSEDAVVERNEPPESWFENQDLRAWVGLGAAWGRENDAPLIESTCRGREGLGFACVRDQGSWQRILRLDLPVVLLLQGTPPQRLLLSGIDGSRLLVGTGADQRALERDIVEQRWFGEFFIAWPQDPAWPREIGLGDEGEAVDMVLEISRLTDRPYTGNAVFGEEYQSWLAAFQRSNGLAPDGIVGPKTLLYLMSDSIEEPGLLTDFEEEVR